MKRSKEGERKSGGEVGGYLEGIGEIKRKEVKRRKMGVCKGNWRQKRVR